MKFSTPMMTLAMFAFLASCGTQTETITKTETTVQTGTEVTTPIETMETTTTNDSSSETTIENKELTYKRPGGETSVVVNAKIQNETIEDLSVVPAVGTDNVSENFIKKFEGAIASELIGKKISDLQNIDAVGGASLTTKAFKEFIETL